MPRFLPVNRMVIVLLAHTAFVGCCLAAGKVPAFDYAMVEQQARNGSSNYVEFTQISDTPIVYKTWGVWNLAGPASEAADIALDFYNYSSVFRNVYRCEPIMAPKGRVSRLGTWFVEGRAAIARVWSIGNIDTLTRGDSGFVRLFATQNEDKYLEATWSRSEHGWLNYRTYGVHLAAFIVPVDSQSCRIGIVSQGIVKEPMPNWLVRMAVKIILPRLMEDVQAEINRRMDLKRPKPPTWHDRWLKTFRGIFF